MIAKIGSDEFKCRNFFSVSSVDVVPVLYGFFVFVFVLYVLNGVAATEISGDDYFPVDFFC